MWTKVEEICQNIFKKKFKWKKLRCEKNRYRNSSGQLTDKIIDHDTREQNTKIILSKATEISELQDLEEKNRKF